MSNVLKGKLGWKGEKGDSAYEIAVKHGYTGTEEQWSEDFLNAENYYDKTEIDTKIADYKLLGDFAVITGNYVYEESVTDKEITLSYPTGFTRDNCVVISIMLGNSAITTKPLGCNSVMTLNSTATGAIANAVVLFESDIRLKLRNLYARDYVESTTPQIMSQELPNLEYKVVLMKIPTQE